MTCAFLNGSRDVCSWHKADIRLQGPRCPDFNEPYTTVSLALAAMAASSSSLMSTTLRKLVASLVNCGGLP